MGDRDISFLVRELASTYAGQNKRHRQAIAAIAEAVERVERERDDARGARNDAIRLMSEYASKLGEMEGRYKAAHWPGIVDEWQAKAKVAEAQVEALRKALEGTLKLLADFKVSGPAVKEAEAALSTPAEERHYVHVDDLNDPILAALANPEPGQCDYCLERDGKHVADCEVVAPAEESSGQAELIRELQHIRVGMLDHYQAATILERLVGKAQKLPAVAPAEARGSQPAEGRD